MKAMVIGLGRVGWEYSKTRGLAASHLGAYLDSPEIDGVIGVDTNNERLKEVEGWTRTGEWLPDDRKWGRLTLTSHDYVEAIKEFHPEICSVCTPTPTHRDIMRDICHKDGPEVICLEKPVATSLDEANMIANRAAYVYGLTEQRKPKVAVHFDRRWHPNWRRIKELLDDGRIGKPMLAVGHHPGPLLRSGIHMLDLFNWYFGPNIVGLYGQSDSHIPSWMTKKMPDTDDWAGGAGIVYGNHSAGIDGQGTRAFLFGGDLAMADYQLFELEIFCDKGIIRVYDNGTVFTEREIRREAKSYGGLPAPWLIWPQDIDYSNEAVDTMRPMVEDLVEAVKNPKHQLATSLEDGVRAQTLVSMIRQSNMNWITPDQVDLKEVVKTH